jgi:glutamine cyclotransferase
MLAILIIFSQIVTNWSCTPEKKNRADVPRPLPEATIIASMNLKNISSTGLASFENQLFVLDSTEAVIKKFDPNNDEPKGLIKLSIKSPKGLTSDGKAIWIADNATKKILQIDPKTGDVIKSFDVPIDADPEHTSIEAIAANGSNIWVALSAGWSSKILKLNSTDGKLISWVFADCLPKGLATDGKELYILAYNKGVLPGSVKKMIISDDMKKMNLSSVFICKTPGKEPSAITMVGKELWISDNVLRTVQKIKLP